MSKKIRVIKHWSSVLYWNNERGQVLCMANAKTKAGWKSFMQGNHGNLVLILNLHNKWSHILSMFDTKAEVGWCSFMDFHILGAVGSWARLLCGVTGHYISACHTVWGGLVLSLAWYDSITGRSWCLSQIFTEWANLLAASQGIARCLFFTALHSFTNHIW